MCKPNTGAWTIGECLKFSISDLVKYGFLCRGCMVEATLTFHNKRDPFKAPTAQIAITAVWQDKARVINLKYALNGKEYDYSIEFIEKPSNLGKGTVLFFLCPVTGKPCRKLYNGYNEDVFKSRDAYSRHIYYDAQICSKLYRPLESLDAIDKRIQKLVNKKRRAFAYSGKVTARASKVYTLSEQAELLDSLRFIFTSIRPAIKPQLERSPIKGQTKDLCPPIFNNLGFRRELYAYCNPFA